MKIRPLSSLPPPYHTIAGSRHMNLYTSLLSCRSQSTRFPSCPLQVRAPSLLVLTLALQANGGKSGPSAPPLGPVATATAAPAATVAPASYATMDLLRVLAFDPEGRPVAFDLWHDDLQLYLLSDIKDSVSLFNHVSGATPAPPATADVSTHSQWLSRDATARLAIRNQLPVTECAHFEEHRTAQPLNDAVVALYSSGGGGGGSGGSSSIGGSGTDGGRSRPRRGGPGGGRGQQQQRRSETQMPQQLREWLVQCGTREGSKTCPYVIRTGVFAGQTCRRYHTERRCFARFDDAWHAEFGDDVEHPRWAQLFQSGVAFFDLDYDVINSTMYALSFSAEGDYYRCMPPDPGIAAAALGGSASGTPLGTAPAEALHTFTLDSGASRTFFRDGTTLNPLPAPVPVFTSP
ncbi:unnamed protein product [Closterium sp. NIES-53]